jgi:hypothetical protein
MGQGVSLALSQEVGYSNFWSNAGKQERPAFKRGNIIHSNGREMVLTLFIISSCIRAKTEKSYDILCQIAET